MHYFQSADVGILEPSVVPCHHSACSLLLVQQGQEEIFKLLLFSKCLSQR